MSTRENPSSAAASWTYRMEVSPTGQNPTAAIANPNDPILLLHLLANLQNQTLEIATAATRDLAAAARDLARVAPGQPRATRPPGGGTGALAGRVTNTSSIPAARRWVASSRSTASLMGELANYVEDNHENLMEGDFSLSDFVDRFGPRLAHLNTMLAVLRPLAAAKPKTE